MSVDDTRLPIATGRQSVAAFWSAARGHRAMLLLSTVFAAVGAALGLVAPVVLGRIVDHVADGTATGSAILGYGTTIAAGAAAAAVFVAAGVVIAARVVETVLAQLREQLVGTALAMPQQRVEAAGTGDLVSRASDDVAQVSDAVPQVVPVLTSAVFTIVVTIGGTLVLDWRYGLVFLIIVPVYILTVGWYLRTAPAIYCAERAAMASRAHHVLSTLRGLDTVLAYRLTERHSTRITDTSWQVVRWSMRARTVQNMFYGRLNVAEYLGLTALLITGHVLIGAGLSTIGAVTTAMLLFLRLFTPINQLMLVIDTLQSAATSLARIVGVTHPTTAGNAPAPSAVSEVSQVALSGVSFSYACGLEGRGQRALHDIDLRIAPGERVAVVGASGAGKTTLAALIAGVHPPEIGTVTRPADTMMITQDAHIFAGSLGENLTLAAPEANATEVAEALELVGASALIDLLPDGLATPVGATGHELTTSQAQQIALARLLLANPELAILDEATAEAGSTHAELLDCAADAALAGRTALVIAHRLSQAAACDRIVVMEHGRIIESGSHTDLLTSGGTYARLWAAWSVGQNADMNR